MARQNAGRDVTTINGQLISVVYVTETPTFDGVIGGYSTVTDGGDAAQPTAAASVSAPNAGAASGADNNSIPQAATATALPSNSVSNPASFTSAASSSNANTAVAGPAATSASDSSSSGSSSGSSSANDGMSTGAKAGLAIGIIAGIGLIAALLLFFIGKKKKQRKEQESRAEDEKKTFGASRNAIGLQSSPSFSSGPAPRLSIRPMSKNLLGDFGFGGPNRRSGGNLLNTVSETPARNASPAPQARTQTPPENPFDDPQNPFADPEKGMGLSGALTGPDARHAPPSGPGARNPPPMTAPPAMAPPLAPNPDRIAFTGSWPAAPAGYDSGRDAPIAMPEPPQRNLPEPVRGPTSEPDDLPIMGAPTPQIPMPSPVTSSSKSTVGGMAAAGAAAAIAGAAAASASPQKQDRRPEPARSEPQPPREETRQQPSDLHIAPREAPRETPREVMPSPGPAPSPALTASASDVPSSPAPSATGAAAAQSGGNVYRVLMDFAPSMDDELELKTGTLVRLLHEYDDGWVSFASLNYRPVLT